METLTLSIALLVVSLSLTFAVVTLTLWLRSLSRRVLELEARYHGRIPFEARR